jgi:hypothetical protein
MKMRIQDTLTTHASRGWKKRPNSNSTKTQSVVLHLRCCKQTSYTQIKPLQ